MTTEQTLEHNRYLMIEQQIRPWDVLDQSILNLLTVVKRENFVPLAYKGLAFADTEIPLKKDAAANEHMMPPRVEARILQELNVKKHERVLEIGAGSGYMAALLAHRAQEVTTVDINPTLAEIAKLNLAENHINNVKVEVADAANGFAKGAPFDVIVISASLPFIPQAFFDQLKVGGRMAAFVGQAPVMEAQLITKTGEKQFETVNLFETNVAPLTNAQQPNKFKF